MLLPRPEIRIATRFGSRIVSRGPVLRGIPRAGLAVDGAAARALFNATDLEDRLLEAENRVSDGLHLAFVGDHRHSDAAVERARHLLRSDSAALLQEREDRRQLP